MSESSSNMSPRILVVVPVYNHASTLRDVVSGILAVHEHVLVVDDGSTDLVPDPSKLDVKVIHHEHNRGKGAAIRAGAKAAQKWA